MSVFWICVNVVLATFVAFGVLEFFPPSESPRSCNAVQQYDDGPLGQPEPNVCFREDLYFSRSYFQSRTRFRVAVEQVGRKYAQLYTIPVFEDPDTGLKYSMDVALVSASPPEETSKTTATSATALPSRRNTKKVLIVTSGLRGVEGYAGAAVQLGALVELRRHVNNGTIDKILTKGTDIVLVHSVNPHGMENNRRVNEAGVDVAAFEMEEETAAADNSHFSYLRNRLVLFVKFTFYHFFATAKDRAVVKRELFGLQPLVTAATKPPQPKQVEVLYQDVVSALYSNPRHPSAVSAVVGANIHTGSGQTAGAQSISTVLPNNNEALASTNAMQKHRHSWKYFSGKKNDDAKSKGEPVLLNLLSHPGYVDFAQCFRKAAATTTVSVSYGTVHPILLAVNNAFEAAAHKAVKGSALHRFASRRLRESYSVPKIQWKRSVLEQGTALFFDLVKALGELGE